MRSFINFMWPILRFILFLASPVILTILLIFICTFFQFLKKRFIEKKKIKKSDVPFLKKDSFFKKMFVQLPERLVEDFFDRDPCDFREFGIHMVCGEQGSGKTMTVVYLLREWSRKYPKMQIYTNMFYKYEDGQLKHWKDLLKHNNGTYGIANVLDEIQTWFSNAESKDLPVEVLGEICQQRKQRKATIGTAQVFNRMAKPFREQTSIVYLPKTFFGCLTVVLKSKPDYYDVEKNKFKKYTGFFFFVHTKEYRNAYDTFRKIEKYKDTNFCVNEQLVSSTHADGS